MSGDPFAAIRAAGYDVTEALPATGDVPAIYLVSTPGDPPLVDDPAASGDYVLSYVTEASAGDYVT
jgi:hypothetical protein